MIYNLTLFLLLQYIIVTVILMFTYDAGNRLAPELDYFLLDKNYLSDLGRSVSFSGLDNPSYIYYSLTLGLVGIGILLFFFLLQNTMSHKAKYVLGLLAIISAMSHIGIALYPVDMDLTRHITFGRLAFLSFFLSTLLAHILLDKVKYKRANTLFYVLNIMLFSYILLLFLGPSSTEGVWALQLKTIAQKVMVYGQILLAWGILITL